MTNSRVGFEACMLCRAELKLLDRWTVTVVLTPVPGLP